MSDMHLKTALNHLEEYKKYSDYVILEGVVGSQSHGTHRPDHPDSIDDLDLMSIVVLPEQYYLGFKQFGSRGTKIIQQDKYDICMYDFKKFMGLLLNNNPNVLGMLWLRESDYTKMTKAGELLIENRSIFSSKQAYKSFTGYAHSQLHRMTHSACQGYMGEKRRKLVEKYGYDCKNASYCIRLLRMGIEFLNTQEVYVFRHDNKQLVEIKYGEWTLDQVKGEADRLFKLAQEALLSSSLPLQPDRERAENLCIKILKERLWNLPIIRR